MRVGESDMMELAPIYGTYKLLDHATIELYSSTDAYLIERLQKRNVAMSVFRPNSFVVPKGTILHVRHFGKNGSCMSIHIFLRDNDKKNPWAGSSNFLRSIVFQGVRLDLEKIS